ncbi:hypothetical protein WMY93_028104 [Mugilogobius chulae]|uniref:Integrase catalytic domain-containing protein n=1 Tax=Mugilogobius chulae TaxID=88201 RepID=A0AAW0MNE3_9GOBI
MAADVETKVRTCPRCVRRKALPEKAAQLVNIKTTRPFELLCMDYLTLEPDTSNTKDVLVLTDHFTKYAVAIPTANQKARTVAKCLWENFIVHYGIPERLHTDQGPDFESKLIKELCQISGIQKTRTTPYHPRGNPVERFNRTLLNMLGTLEQKQKATWKEYVRPMVHAYNCTRNEVTGFTPYELMFGRSPRLPVDIAFGLPAREPASKSHSQYVQNLRSRLEESYQLAFKMAEKNAERNKQQFDQRVTPSSLEEGDRVLVRNVRLRGKHKLEDKWERDVYVVIKRAGDLPVYTVRPEHDATGPTRTLHRDLLLPCGFLPAAANSDSPASTPVRRPRTRSQPVVHESDGDMGEEDVELDTPQFYIPPTIKDVITVPVLPNCESRSIAPDASLSNALPDPVVSEPPSPAPHHLPQVDADGDRSVPCDVSLPVEETEHELENHLPETEESPHSCGAEDEESELEPVPQAQVETSPNLIETSVNQAEEPVQVTVSDDTSYPRRSIRQRQPPKRFQYSTLACETGAHHQAFSVSGMRSDSELLRGNGQVLILRWRAMESALSPNLKTALCN